MVCKQWKDAWVAHLYGELEADDERQLTEHLTHCASCPSRRRIWTMMATSTWQSEMSTGPTGCVCFSITARLPTVKRRAIPLGRGPCSSGPLT